MKLIVNLKLNPTKQQAAALKQTLERANAACDWISQQGWETQPKPTTKQFALHKLTYHAAKEKFDLTAQMVIRCIAKVADAYKLDDRVQRRFKKHGSIAYDERIIRFTKADAVNLWTVDGRETIPFVCGDYQRRYLPFRRGEVDLVYRQGMFFLNAVCDIETPPAEIGDDVLGVDFGIVNIAVTSDGAVMSGADVERVRRTYSHRRRNLQRKGTRSAKRKLKQLSGAQSRLQRNTNHCLSKSLVLNAKCTNRAVAIEELQGIGKRVKVRKRERARHANWSLYQLRTFLEYKSKLSGILVHTVDPRDTSRECSVCGFTAKENRKFQDKFLCQSCGHRSPADFNAARNIRARAISTRQTNPCVQGVRPRGLDASRRASAGGS